MNFVQVEFVIGMVMVQIKVNGEFEIIENNITIAELLSYRKLPSVFVVELNKNIIKKDDYNKIFLKDGDIVEIATFCAGG